MKYQWELQDVTVGRRVWSHNKSEQYIIGYDPSVTTDSRHTLVSLSDGMMAVKNLTPFEMGNHLNSAEMIPDSI